MLLRYGPFELPEAVVRIVQNVDLELCDVVEVRRRLAAELQARWCHPNLQTAPERTQSHRFQPKQWRKAVTDRHE
eukprot:3705021-Amphidinium_carterae.1